MRVYREPDAFVTNDRWLKRALQQNGTPASAVELDARAQAWRPWRAYAAMLLWDAYLDAGIDGAPVHFRESEPPRADQVA
jgi:3-methyladenine DNA glycosylase/8-oxoguanine DNA glycosylase